MNGGMQSEAKLMTSQTPANINLQLWLKQWRNNSLQHYTTTQYSRRCMLIKLTVFYKSSALLLHLWVCTLTSTHPIAATRPSCSNVVFWIDYIASYSFPFVYIYFPAFFQSTPSGSVVIWCNMLGGVQSGPQSLSWYWESWDSGPHLWWRKTQETCSLPWQTVSHFVVSKNKPLFPVSPSSVSYKYYKEGE